MIKKSSRTAVHLRFMSNTVNRKHLCGCHAELSQKKAKKGTEEERRKKADDNELRKWPSGGTHNSQWGGGRVIGGTVCILMVQDNGRRCHLGPYRSSPHPG